MRWGVPRFMKCIWYGTLLVSMQVITILVGGREVGSPTVYEGYMVRYIVGFCVVITIYVGGREVGSPRVYEGYLVRYIVGF